MIVTPPESFASPSRVISAFPLSTLTGNSSEDLASAAGDAAAASAGSGGTPGHRHSLAAAGGSTPVVASKAMIRREITGVGKSIMRAPQPSPLHDNERQRRSAAAPTGTMDR